MKKLQWIFKYSIFVGIVLFFCVVSYDRAIPFRATAVDLTDFFSKIDMFRCLDEIKEYKHTQDKGLVKNTCTDVILEPDTCREQNGVKVFLVMIAISTPSDFETRQAIRQTWGSITQNDESVRLVFLMGRTNQENIHRDVYKESSTYGDVILGDFKDTYANLTLKSIAMLKWAATICQNAKYIVKVDTDVYLHVDNLLRHLKLLNPRWSILGRKIHVGYPDRDKSSKFYISYSKYPYKAYPSYITGPTYVISGDLLPSLEKVAYITELLPFEDVHVTGFCGLSVKANLIMDNKFAIGRRILTYCNFHEVINGHGYKPDELRELHKKITGNNIDCLFSSIGKYFFTFE